MVSQYKSVNSENSWVSGTQCRLQQGSEMSIASDQFPYDSAITLTLSSGDDDLNTCDLVPQHSAVNSDKICSSEKPMAASALWPSQHGSEDSMPPEHPSHDSVPEPQNGSQAPDRTTRAGSQVSMTPQHLSHDYDTATVHSAQYPGSQNPDRTTRYSETSMTVDALWVQQHDFEASMTPQQSPDDRDLASQQGRKSSDRTGDAQRSLTRDPPIPHDSDLQSPQDPENSDMTIVAGSTDS